MLIIACILGWLLCGISASWLGHYVLNESELDTTACEVFWITILGVSALVAVVVVLISEQLDKFNLIIFKAKNE